MKISDARLLAVELMEKHGLIQSGWQFKLDRAIKRFGICYQRRKLISMSKKLIEANSEEQVRDTILHEIAHALVDFGVHHGLVWKLKAIEIGAKPVACYSSDVERVKTDWRSVCVDCGRSAYRVRRPSPSMLSSGYHVPCKNKINKGDLLWFFKDAELLKRNIADGTRAVHAA